MIDVSNRPKMEDIYPYLAESIRDGGQFVIFPRGTSMNPTIYEDRDCVALVEAKELCVYDIVLYKRQNGRFILHRIMKIKDGNYTMCGDNQYIFEEGIKREQILAVVSEVRKEDGRVFDRSKIHADGKRFSKSLIKKLRRIKHRFKTMIKGEKR